MMGITRKCTCSLIFGSVLFCAPTAARTQTPSFTLNQQDRAHLDSLAALTAKKIREAKIVEKESKVLMMDFFRDSTGQSSHLGTLLADRFSESLARYSAGMQILDRKILRDYLTENWTTLEDFRSNDLCLRVARQLGASGAVLGILAEKSGNINLTLHLEGFGPTDKEDDIFAWRNRTTSFPVTEEVHTALYRSGPNYTRSPDKIPEEPGVFVAGVSGVTQPECKYCPNPDYSDAARAGKFQGTTILSVVVTHQGEVTGIYLLKGAPFGLTDQAIKAVKNWRFQPSQKDGKPVPVRVSVEVTFRLLSGPDSP
jgi:TonB family protein